MSFGPARALHRLAAGAATWLAAAGALAPPLGAQPIDSLVGHALRFAQDQLVASVAEVANPQRFPRSTRADGTWSTEDADSWTSGFFPGCLWRRESLARQACRLDEPGGRAARRVRAALLARGILRDGSGVASCRPPVRGRRSWLTARSRAADNPGSRHSSVERPNQEIRTVARSPSPWWLLLILPLGLAAGWLAGQMPTPDSSATGQPTSHEMTASAGRSPGNVEISAWTTMNAALAESRRTGKPILLDFNADWCGPCRRMKQEVFEGARGQAVQAAVIPVSLVDRAREDGRNSPELESLQRQYQVDAFPTLVVLSPATGRVVQTKGFGGGEQTLAWIQDAARAVR